MRRTVIFVIIVFVISINAVVLIAHSPTYIPTFKSLGKNETYRIVNNEYVPKTDVSTFCVTENMIMLYYDESGLTNVYFKDGTFSYGIQTETSRNGRGGIVYKNGLLYIMSRSNRIYIFNETELIDSFLPSQNRTEFFRIEEIIQNSNQHTLGSETYYYLPSINKITKSTEQGKMEDVIILPEKNDEASLILLLVAVFCATNLLSKNWKHFSVK